nr:YjbQ family protein [Chroococcidiopsis sp. CCMEE 29]
MPNLCTTYLTNKIMMNAHSHLMAMMLSTSEVILLVDGKLAMGNYQSILFFELDAPRKRTVFCQISSD